MLGIEMTVWKGTWKPDGTGGWHTKSDKDIIEQYNSARLTPAPAQMLEDAIDEIVRLRAENEKLRAALKPFADAADELEDKEHGAIWESPAAMCITANDLRNCQILLDSSRAARAAMEGKDD